MKSKAILVALSLFAFAFTAAAQSPSKAPQPVASIASLEHSFGNVKPGTPLTYTFMVKNRGKADLAILSVNPSCGCTTSSFDKVVAPGKEGKITLAIEKTESYKGEIVKTASVSTNDPDRQSLTLTLRANFVAE